MNIFIPDDQVSSCFVYLALGVLHAIDRKVLEPSIGIWTLGIPHIGGSLVGNPMVPSELLDIYEMGDELSALRKLDPGEYERTIPRLIQQLEHVLTNVDDTNQTWMSWRINRPKEE